MHSFHDYLSIISPELALISVLIGFVQVIPMIKSFFSKPEDKVFTDQTNLPAASSEPFVSVRQEHPYTRWDRLWLSICRETAISLDELFSQGLEGVLVGLFIIAALGWSAVENYNKEIAAITAVINILCIISVSLSLTFFKRVKKLSVFIYIRHLVTCAFSTASIYILRFVDSLNIDGIWALLYYTLRAIGIILIVIPVLLSSGSIISSIRMKNVFFNNDWHYLLYSVLSVILISDVAFFIIRSLVESFL